MKKFLSKLCVVAIGCQLIAIGHTNAQLGTWTKLTNTAPDYNQGVMLLMTDGTVMCFSSTGGGGAASQWNKLTPDAHGSYINGTWTAVTSMNNPRLFFASQVLPSGKLFVSGGEYGSGGTLAETYDPVANTWSAPVTVPNGWSVFDGNSELLYNGDVLVGPQVSVGGKSILLWNPALSSYSTGTQAPYSHDEAAWLKLPDSTVLYVGIGSTSSSRYRPKTATWLNDVSTTPNNMYDPFGSEAGGALQLPNGKDIFFGSTKFNCFYTPSGVSTTPGTWTAATNLPVIGTAQTGQVDAPSAMMVNGHILLAVSPGNSSGADQFRTPIWFLEYDYNTGPGGTFTQNTTNLPGVGADSIASIPCNFATFLNLPDGNILFGIEQENVNTYWVYTPGSGPIAAGKPVLDSITQHACGNTYEAYGKLFNGISEGASFGDDWQMSTNYPLVRLANGTNIWYAKTTNWNRLGFVAAQAAASDSLLDSCTFTLPAGLPVGTTYTAYVVVNGFQSNAGTLKTLGSAIASQTNITCHGGTGSVTVNTAIGGVAPYTYLWAPSGGSNLSLSGLSAGTYTLTVTDARGCTATTGVSITQPATLATTITKVAIFCNGGTGILTAHPSGGTTPYTYSWSSGATTQSNNGLTAGSYTVNITDSHGCTLTSTASLTQPTAITTVTNYVAASTAASCNGEAYITASGGTPGYGYSWSPGGQTTDTIKGQCAGAYCCTVTDNNGCSTSTCVTIWVTGIQNISNTSPISIYPDPNNGSFTVSGIIWGQVIELYNDLGQKISTSFAENTTMSFDISTRPGGVYLVRILNSDGSLVSQKKIIKVQ